MVAGYNAQCMWAFKNDGGEMESIGLERDDSGRIIFPFFQCETEAGG